MCLAFLNRMQILFHFYRQYTYIVFILTYILLKRVVKQASFYSLQIMSSGSNVCTNTVAASYRSLYMNRAPDKLYQVVQWLACSPRVLQTMDLNPNRLKPRTIKCVFVASPLNMQYLGESPNTGGLGNRIMCPSGRHVYLQTVVSVG